VEGAQADEDHQPGGCRDAKIPLLGDPEDAADARWAFRRACHVVDELIDLIETDRKVDPDFAYELIERGKRIKRILEWNTETDRTT
jgi:hypothetical protein